MASIIVEHSKFEAAAKAIDTYVADVKREMKSADVSVNTLAGAWQGKDYTQFFAQWDKVTGSGSTYMEMIKALEHYSEYLRFAAKKYKNAQADAVNRANRLPR